MPHAGGDDDGGGGGGPSGSGSDEEYVQSLCDSFEHFSEAMEDLLTGVDQDSSVEELTAAFVEPFEHFVDDLKDARPPSDVKPYHDDLIEQMQSVVDRIEDGDFDALDDNPISEPPANVQARLQAVAEANSTCTEAGFDFE